MIKSKFIYLGYYIVKTPRKEFFRFFSYVKKKNGLSSFALIKDIFSALFKYNISLMDYFHLRFFEKDEKQRLEYAGTGFMYQYQLLMNPMKHRDILLDKIKFLTHFNEFSGRRWGTIPMLENDPALAAEIITEAPYRVVLKKSRSNAGKGIKVLETRDMTVAAVLQMMRSGGYDLIEKFLLQHDHLMKLSDTALNTIRIVTQFHEGEITVIAASLRVSVNCKTDNLSTGNFAAPVDLNTGALSGPGVYLDIAKPDVLEHPVSGIPIVGYRIPLWKECIELVTRAAKSIPQTKSVGWDVAITNERPVLVEGNHDWGKILWQLPEKKGLKKDIARYLPSSTN